MFICIFWTCWFIRIFFFLCLLFWFQFMILSFEPFLTSNLLVLGHYFLQQFHLLIFWIWDRGDSYYLHFTWFLDILIAQHLLVLLIFFVDFISVLFIFLFLILWVFFLSGLYWWALNTFMLHLNSYLVLLYSRFAVRKKFKFYGFFEIQSRTTVHYFRKWILFFVLWVFG